MYCKIHRYLELKRERNEQNMTREIFGSETEEFGNETNQKCSSEGVRRAATTYS
ncbi:hypothetical protein HanRHA438_Chr16g0762551 [Helianthus annuus]|nr:hypothetical protein HanRHA438_Chr16g0762551 [Helianthus annuus]